ncbi:MOSC domain-containing protein [Streptomyces sp. NPDC006660]|uniref:MOSC domain-containing protein n=1 Tax=Streptomyces sp. NPDC006660 TaxID=3156901 RepID=UPI0033CEEC6C
MELLSVNVGRAKVVPYTDAKGGLTGVDKRPVSTPVRVFAPGPRGVGASGVEGDDVCDLRHHGGDHQAVYAYAREDLDAWEKELGRALPNGSFGENLTTYGTDVNDARIGERWRIGRDVVLEVACGRIPCRTFAGWLEQTGWVRRFTQAAVPGAFFRVIEPGTIRAGDPVEVIERPDHEVSVALWFRAFTTERTSLPRVLAAGDALDPEAYDTARKYLAQHGS